MIDLISRQAAIDRFCELLDTTEENPVTCIRQVLDILPSAQPEIIHCRDCKKCQIDSVFQDYWCDGRKVREDFYCGDAVRKENR